MIQVEFKLFVFLGFFAAAFALETIFNLVNVAIALVPWMSFYVANNLQASRFLS
jgi:hypothetical protein